MLWDDSGSDIVGPDIVQGRVQEVSLQSKLAAGYLKNKQNGSSLEFFTSSTNHG